MKIASTFLGAAVLALTAAPALAAYPERPVTLLIPFSPGGGNDTGARIYEPCLEECLGEDIVIVNKPGAGGELGFAELAQVAPDGYMIALVDRQLRMGPSISKRISAYTKRPLYTALRLILPCLPRARAWRPSRPEPGVSLRRWRCRAAHPGQVRIAPTTLQLASKAQPL